MNLNNVKNNKNTKSKPEWNLRSSKTGLKK